MGRYVQRSARALLGIAFAVLAQASPANEQAKASDYLAHLAQALTAQPENVEAMQNLAAALLAQVRIAPRVADLARAEALIARLVTLHAPRADALDAWRLLIGHHFDAALNAARRARATGGDPLLAAVSEADALVELGRYDEAERAVQDLLDQHYGIAALARASHLRRLFGDLPGAIELAEVARTLTRPGVDRAWLALDVAELRLMSGAPALALSLASTALTELPAAALVMQARARHALGDSQAALALYRAAASQSLRADTLLEVTRLARLRGDDTLAARTGTLLEAMARLDSVNGASDRRSFVEFHLDRGELRPAEDLARAEWRERPDVYSAAQLAWVLFRAGKRDEAGAYAARAMAENTVDPLLNWRAGTVLAALGDRRGKTLIESALTRQPWLASEATRLAARP